MITIGPNVKNIFLEPPDDYQLWCSLLMLFWVGRNFDGVTLNGDFCTKFAIFGQYIAIWKKDLGDAALHFCQIFTEDI